ncbi:MAG: cyclic pyranopterin monophosphate synthase MoaC [Gammaproteobacteria bacterium]|nr:cyclic pyranopterin monophosphate synthase MoaC [Gammaproteobacteria bacterium]
MPKLTHFSETGEAQMVDISEKEVTHREAIAEALVRMQPTTLSMIFDGKVPKGDVIATARIAAIQAAKRTSDIIPLCHPLPIAMTSISVEKIDAATLRIESTCRVTGRTGVEMEALTAVSIAGLTIYDMCKSIEKGIRIEAVRLVSKTGGKSGTWKVSSDSK